MRTEGHFLEPRITALRSGPRATALAAAMAAILGSPSVLAQEEEEPERIVLEEIVVTTRFREEPLQQIPLAISAITAESLTANGATDVLDIADWAPNVTIDQLGSGWGPTLAANIRGLGYGDFKPVVEQTVTFYVDDVVLGRPTGAILDLLDLERVEVLRGPQGTLFGRNAIGGVVRLVSRKPGEGTDVGDIELTVGSYDRLDLRGSFETTLVEDKLFGRVAFVSKTRNGWQNNVDFVCQMIQNGTPELAGIGDGIVGWTPDPAGPTVFGGGPGAPVFGPVGSDADNAFSLLSTTRVSERGTDRNCVLDRFGDEDVQAARGALRFTPSDRFEINFSADVTDQENTSPYDRIADISDAPPFLLSWWTDAVGNPTYGVPYDDRFVPPSEDVNYSGFNSNLDGIETPNINNVNHWGTGATFDWYLDNLDVKLILAHREFDAQWGRDSDGSPMPINHTLDTFRNDQDTLELRVSGELFNGRTAWTVGYFSFESHDFNSNISVLMPCIFGTSCIDRVDNVFVDNTGVFINTVTDLTDRLSLTVGLRNTDDEKNIIQERFDRNGALCCGFDPVVPIRADSSETDPMVSLSYQVNDEIMVYGTYQEGFRGGGTTPRPTGTTRVPFGPETLENFEVGMKSDLVGGRLRLNASVFDMTYKDIQQNAAGIDELGQAAWLITNAGEADITGFEVEATATLGQHWLIDANLAHTDFQLTDLGNADPAVQASLGLTGAVTDINETPDRTPDYTAAINFGYITNLRNGAELSFRYGATWRDDATWGADANPNNTVPAHTITNARVTWVSAAGDWQASLFCTNCSDERTTQSRLDFLALFGSLQETFIRPVEWGLSIKKSF